MALVNPEAAIIFVYISFFYNSLLAIKLIYDTFVGKVEKRKIAWNIISAALIFTGTLLMFLWFPRAFTPVIGWDAFVGIILLFVNNLTATILAFMNRIEASRIAKAGYVIFTLLALVTMMQYLHKISALTPFILPREFGWLTLIPSIGYAQFQAFFYGSIGYFYPTLIFIPIAVPIKFRRDTVKKTEKVANDTKSTVRSKKTRAVGESTKSTSSKSSSNQKKEKKNVFFDKVVEEKPEEIQRPPLFASLRRFMDNATKAIYGALAILLLVFAGLGIGTMTSFNPYTSPDYLPVYPQRDDFEFGVSLKTISYQTVNLSGYEQLFQEELDLIIDLGVTVARLDIRMELLDNFSTELNESIATLKANGFKIMLSTYGYAPPTWFFQDVNFSDFTQVIHDQSVQLVQYYQPDYLLIYPEPFGFSSAFVADLQDAETWTTVINDTSNYIHSISNETSVGINLSFNDFDPSINLFEHLWKNSTLDFIGMDYYIIHARDLNFSYYLDMATGTTKDFWFTEFGVSAVVYGERTQAGALAGMLENCLNNDKIKGFVYYSLLDDFYGANTLGLVTETGYRRMAYHTYKEIIAQVIV
ncbi:MAG: hypothetical protein KGD64_04695 [Candidatus Heimdallarchaeota archaeon]|nr:hypothetical protein [Candidatus Heimdallarchaeota archaeon]